MGGNSSFYYTNPTPAVVPGLSAELVAATTAATNAAAAANAQLAAYTVVTDTWSSSVTIDWSLANCHRLTLTGTPTALTFTNGVDGEKLILELKQDSVGSRLVTLPSNVRYSTTIPSILLSTAANRIDKLGFMFNSVDGKYDLVAVSYGFI